MAELLTLPSRPCRTEDGVLHPSEMLTAEYDEEEMAVMRALREGGHIDEMAALHEAKALLGARIVPEQAELATNDLRPSEEEALSLFDDLEAKNPDFKVPDGVRRMFGEVAPEPDMRDPEPPAWSTPTRSEVPGRFSGHDATATERAAGDAKEEEDSGPLKPGSAAHSVLLVYGDRKRRTSYQASFEACDDFHARRRESTRLLTRGFLRKSGTLPNPAPGGREHVDAYEVTVTGLEELARLRAEGGA